MFAEGMRLRAVRHDPRSAIDAGGSSSVLRVDGSLIVIEGAQRVAWQRVGTSSWQPVSLWPNRIQARELGRHLESGAPLLVVVSQLRTVVPMLAEEFAQAPSALRHLASDWSGEVVDVAIPALDWLPSALRARGLHFLEDTDDLLAATPRGLTPPLIVEEADTVSNVRFVRATRSITPTIDDAAKLLDHCFPTELQSARAS